MFAQPPGADYCDIYLLDYANGNAFSSDQAFSYIIEGSRENLKSSTIKLDCCLNENQYYLGIRNNDSLNGIHIGIEVVAIIKEGYLDFE